MTNNLTKLSFILVIGLILANLTGLLAPTLNSNDAYFYAVISKNILTNHDWLNLYYQQHDWLDKPHLPFWITALAFKTFGVNSFAYVLPGFIFNLIGAYYTYLLAKLLYNTTTAQIALVIYLSALHLMLSAIDIRAEAFLLGEIMPAVYYWLIYDKASQIKYLFLAALFTGLALMSKGLFVAITIFSGLVIRQFYQGRYFEFLRPKWLIAYSLSLVVALPEIFCLYWQFDLHPEKVVFGTTHVSGVAWYFWGSQFGRFFNSGPIINTHGSPFYFVHTFLWAFLPWSLIFIAAVVVTLNNFSKCEFQEKAQQVYLHAYFWFSFLMFSATKFQLDHYTNIIMPFAAILSANYLWLAANLKCLLKWQFSLCVILNMVLVGLILKIGLSQGLLIIPIFALIGLIYLWYKLEPMQLLLSASALTIAAVFVSIMSLNSLIYPRYNIAYQVANYLKQQNSDLPIYVYQANGVINGLEFHALAPVVAVAQIGQIKSTNYYLVTSSELGPAIKAIKLANFSGIAQEKFISYLLQAKLTKHDLEQVNLYLINKP